jgi:cytochrome c
VKGDFHRWNSNVLDSFELNKVLGAVLGTCLFLVAIHIAAQSIFTPPRPAQPGFEIEVPTEPGAQSPTETPAAQPIEQLLAKASPERGEAAAKACATCHTFNKSGADNVGPNLYGVVGRAKGSEQGFNYSAAMKAKGGEWTFAELNEFLTSPRAAVPGTAMTFAGISRPQQRADVIDYLHTLADNPVPLPSAEQTQGAGNAEK